MREMSQQFNILSGVASQNHSPHKLNDVVNKCLPLTCSLLGPIGKLNSHLNSIFSSVDISYFAPKGDRFLFSRQTNADRNGIIPEKEW